MEKDTTALKIINFEIDYHKPSILIQSDWWVLIILVLIIALGGWIYRRYFRNNYHVSEFTVKMFDVEFKLQRTYENLYIANRIYIELITRKAAIPIDEEHDVIEEVYDSWYKLFGIVRDEIKSVPGQYLQSHDPTKALIGLTTKILNSGLRPHLTEYQAKFRKWLKTAKEDAINKNLTPQELQKKYPDFANLVASMKLVNGTLTNYADELDKLIKGK
jgi:hypothetical protein